MTHDELLSHLEERLRISRAEVEKIVLGAPHRYRRYWLAKRTGGYREIFHPTPELKVAQRWLVEHVLNRLPVHNNVFSYRDGRSIRDHAELHRRSKYFLKLDATEFFPSIRDYHVRSLLRANRSVGLVALDDEAIEVIVRLVCRVKRGEPGSGLSIGAPSSPAISNAVLFDLDSSLFELALERNVIYSRYADDVYFSSREPRAVYGIEPFVRSIISSSSQIFRVNEAKTVRTTKKRRVVVTGLNITSENKISVGRSLKRKIKTEVYLVSVGGRDSVDIPRLRGLLSYCNGVEPSFVVSLEKKFGSIVQAIMHSSEPP